MLIFSLSLISAMKKMYFFQCIESELQSIILLKIKLFGVTKMCFIDDHIFFQKIFRIALPLFSKSCDENKFVKPVRLLRLNIKSINQIQKYPHIIESQARNLKKFVMIFLLPKNFLISFGVCSTLKLSNHVTLLSFT